MTTPITLTDTEQPSRAFITAGVRQTVLSNGLTVLTKELHNKPIVASIIWYRVGSRNEELGQTGKSHFLEHMLFKGTDRFRKGEIDLITLENGGANNAFTWLDFTAYYFTFASDRWQAALEIEASRMRDTLFDEQEFESEKQVVEEELRIGLDGPWEVLENEVWATAFRQHPYHWPTVGWLEDLEAATAADMKAYYDKWYHPRNATVVIVGDFQTDDALATIERLFGAIPAGQAVTQHHIIEPPQRGEKRIVVKKETPVERLLIGYHAPAVGDADAYVLHVIETLLSTGKSSRLYQRLVETDRSVTSVKASYNDHIDPSLFYLQAEVKPGFTLTAVEQAIIEEIDRLQNEALPFADLEKAKRQIEADLVLGSEEYLQQAILLGQYQTIAAAERVPMESRGYHYLDTLIARIQAVTAEDVARVARQYLVADNRTVGYLLNDEAKNGRASHPQDEDEGLAAHRSSAYGDRDAQLASPVSWGGRPARRAAFRSGVSFPDSPLRFSFNEKALPTRITERTRSHSSSALGSGAKSTEPQLEVERVVLPNGLVLLLSENHSTPSVSVNAVVRTGSRYEDDEQAGLASLVGEMIAEGTFTRTAQQIAETIEAVGGRLATFGDYQISGVVSSLLSQDAALGLEIAADLLQQSIFPEGKVRQQIERRAAQIKSRLDVPRTLASDAFNEIVFKGTPRHRPAFGYEMTVPGLSRDAMIGFYQRYYLPNNTMLAIVGDIDRAAIKRKVEEVFGGWGSVPDFRLPQVAVPTRQSESIDKFIHAPKEQVNIFIGHLGIQRSDADYYALLVMDTILGSSPGFTSRIPRILRDEQGLAYTTFSNITSSAGIDPGRFVAYIGTSPANLGQALSGLRREITRIVEEPVTEEELAGAKAYLTGNFVFDFQTNSQIASFLIESEVYGLGFDYLQRYPERIRAVTIDDVARVARLHIDPQALTTVVVGPVNEDGTPIAG